MERTPEQIQKEIDALHAEVEEIRKQSDLLLDKKASIERQERELKNRLQEIIGYKEWRGSEPGLIKNLELKLKECDFPIYKDDYRIVSVTDKTISLKRNGNSFDDVIKYNKQTGWKSRARSDWDAIDAQKALEIWNTHRVAK